MFSMATPSNSPMIVATILFNIAFLFLSLHPAEAQIGVCYGGNGNNLPSKQDVVNLYKSNQIGAMRMYAPDQTLQTALQGSGIKIILGVPNDNLQSLASDQSAANQWVQTNVVPYGSSIKYIAVGNEVHPSDQQASSVQPAMQNVLNALNSNGLGGQMKVSTSIDTTLITNSFPPSNGQFSDSSYITPIINFLKSNGSPLLVNIYPYFAYINNEGQIRLDYALFTASGTVANDPNNGLNYQNLFDALVDAVYAALGRADAHDIAIVVSESGWPSEGGDAATVDNAGTYYRNLISHVKQGTPLKQQGIETYLFAMFDENNKQGAPTEQHFGLFSPNQQPKYGQLNFN
ncbi:glucan endo-1,3-beta-glucosidase-like [Chenopodium quinoa]|uniref:Glucan endo-1,3-beta-D-glucosidase n=1 Tax=Chenopodium quinoa TaxID=63459 RepID=A0A803NAX3_CHEQI|nr:glucan endo-1,3-beta-glucosidase-like [Chenopodium quinoa]